MRQVLRDMRYLTADLVRRDMHVEADWLLEMVVQFPRVKQPERIREWRSILLVVQEKLRAKGLTTLQDSLSVILSQFRAREHYLGGCV